jgi:hypothetical protein
MPARTDRGQRAALGRGRAAFGDVQVLAVHPTENEGEPAGRSLAGRQLALTLPARVIPRRRRRYPRVGQAVHPTATYPKRGCHELSQ